MVEVLQNGVSRRRLGFAVTACVLFGAATSASAQGVADFYRGRTLKLIVPTAPGGINDLSARLVSRHLARFLPGAPEIKLEYHEEGGLAVANNFVAGVPRDGSVIAVIQRAVPQLAIQGDPDAKFDPLTFTWLGSLSSFADDAYMIVVNADYGAKSAADLAHVSPPARLGANGVGSTNYTIAVVAKDALGYKLDVNPDFPGAANISKAMRDHTLDGQVIGLNSFSTNQKEMWNGKQVRPLVQFGRTTRHPDLADVPTARELTTDPKALAVIEFAELPFLIALPFMAPPGIPEDRAAALRDGFSRMMRDPDFLADAKVSQLGISPVSGAEVDALLRKAMATPKDVIAHYNAIAAVPK